MEALGKLSLSLASIMREGKSPTQLKVPLEQLLDCLRGVDDDTIELFAVPLKSLLRSVITISHPPLYLPAIQCLLVLCKQGNEHDRVLLDILLRFTFIEPLGDLEVLEVSLMLMLELLDESFVSDDRKPQLFCLLSNCLDLSKSRTMKSVRICALELIRKVLLLCKSNQVMEIVPGIASGMTKILLGDFKQGSDLFALAIDNFSLITQFASQSSSTPDQKTVSKLEECCFLIFASKQTQHHQLNAKFHEAKRKALVNLLQNCSYTTAKASEAMLDSLIALSQSREIPIEIVHRSKTSLKQLGMSQTIQHVTLLEKIKSMPRFIETETTAPAQQFMQILLGYLDLFAERVQSARPLWVVKEHQFQMIISILKAFRIYINAKTVVTYKHPEDYPLRYAPDTKIHDLMLQFIPAFCRVFGSLDVIDSLFVVLADTESRHLSAEVMLVMALILKTCDADLKHIVDRYIDTVLHPDLFQMDEKPIQQIEQSTNSYLLESSLESESDIEVLRRNAYTVALILNGFTYFHKDLECTHFQVFLYPLLEKTSSTSFIIAENAKHTLQCLAMPHPVHKLISQYSDYLLDTISFKFRYESDDLKTASMLRVLVKDFIVASDFLPLLSEIAKDALDALDVFAFNNVHAKAYLGALHVIVEACKPIKEVPVCSVAFEWDFVPQPFHIANKDPFMDSEERSVIVEEKEPPLEVKMVSEILHKMKHFVFHKDFTLRALALDTISAGLLSLHSFDSIAMPLIAQTWTPLRQNFDERRGNLFPHLIDVLMSMEYVAPMFVSRRMAKELWPVLRRNLLLIQNDTLSFALDNKEYFETSVQFKVQKNALYFVTNWISYGEFHHLDLEQLLHTILPYLSTISCEKLHEKAVQVIHCLCKYEIDYVWSFFSEFYEKSPSPAIRDVIQWIDGVPEQPLKWMGYTF